MKIRVAIVDDSSAYRALLRKALSADETFDVVIEAGSAEEALEALQTIKVDSIVLDVEMPGMGGLAMLQTINLRHRGLPVIMCSAVTERGAIATLEALGRGAVDYVTKSNHGGGPRETIDYLKAELLPKLRFFGGRRQSGAHAKARKRADESGPTRQLSFGPHTTAFLAVAASTGGPAALETFIKALPADFPVPVAIVQHMPPVFTGLLAQSLNAHTPLTVVEASAGAVFEPGVVMVARGGSHLRVERKGGRFVAAIGDDEPMNSCRPSADALFESVAKAYGRACIAVVLTGMGRDGLLGAARIHDVHGRVVVQDERSSVVWGMPGAIAKKELADAILPLRHLGTQVVRSVIDGQPAGNT